MILKACPFCSGLQLSVMTRPILVGNITYTLSYVQCDYCGCCGPSELDESKEQAKCDAQAEWNYRQKEKVNA